MAGRNSATVAAWWTDGERIRDRVDGGDKEQKADQNCGVFAFQNTLEHVKAVFLPVSPLTDWICYTP
jgi:hypothetical protein